VIPLRLLCAAELEEGASRGIDCEVAGKHTSVVVIRRGRVYAYLNSCPHTGAPLEWLPHRFLDASGSFIQCATHGALFQIEDGRCIWGPCAGAHLKPVQIAERDGQIYLDSL
jgi:nitrite reductase/ring-hydroxylating ferredoxin subunit